MDWMALAQAALLGVVEGVTEFLPISSTGHLILLVDMLKFQGPEGKVFEVAIQLGAIAAVMWLYRQRVVALLRGMFTCGPEQAFVLAMAAGVLPAMVLGLMFHKAIKQALYTPTVVACALIAGGVVMLVIERLKPPVRVGDVGQIGWRHGLLVGLAQSVALIPGVSRSGATIMGGLLCGIERRAAAEFSFFLAMPTMILAVTYDLFKNRDALTTDGMGLIAVGFVAAFLTAQACVAGLMRFLGTHGFAPFALYRIGLGALILLLGSGALGF